MERPAQGHSKENQGHRRNQISSGVRVLTRLERDKWEEPELPLEATRFSPKPSTCRQCSDVRLRNARYNNAVYTTSITSPVSQQYLLKNRHSATPIEKKAIGKKHNWDSSGLRSLLHHHLPATSQTCPLGHSAPPRYKADRKKLVFEQGVMRIRFIGNGGCTSNQETGTGYANAEIPQSESNNPQAQLVLTHPSLIPAGEFKPYSLIAAKTCSVP